MKSYLLTFRTQTPLLLSERQTGQTSQSLDYIAGSTFMGGLAMAYLRMHGLSPQTPDAVFNQFFQENLNRFGNLYPANVQSFRSSPYPVKPLPLTARSCKRWDGFTYRVHENAEKRHGVADHLIRWGLFQETNNLELLDKTHRYCQVCGTERLDAFRGYYQRYAPHEYEHASLNRRLVTGTGINRLTGAVNENILFNYEVIAEMTAERKPQEFQGLLHLDDAVAPAFMDFLNADELNLRVGRAKTRGFGLLKLHQCEAAQFLTLEQFSERLKDFDAKVKEIAQTADDSPFYFAVTCCSDLILPTADGRYSTRLNENALAQQPGWKGMRGVKLIYHHAATCRVKGWNVVWRLPKPVELAIGKGSAFLFAYQGDARDELINKLYALEQQGIGSRTCEGFGWVSISDEFHQEDSQI